jgi:hypothetical protein
MHARALIPLLITCCWGPAALSSEREEFFEARVRPLLAKRCYECHRRRAEGGLRLDSLQAILKGGSSGPAIAVGDAKMSLLWQVTSGGHAEISMPPDDPLGDGEIKVFEKWIAAGAVWPRAVASARTTTDENGITDAERSFWSFQRITKPPIPQIDGLWRRNPIDAFIALQHKQRGLTPADTVDHRTLIRRITYDLTGLPPTPEEVADFQLASSRDPQSAYADLIERLLASRSYGERWGQHWLDLVRYADTAGDAADFPVPEAYKYRNYVIDAFNDDKPYDQFVREQIAGDLMPGEDDEETWQRVIATGYIAISRRIGVSPHGQRHITIEDTLNNLGKTFLGLSIGCARCHDHKFDPIPTADYYALYGIFDSTVYPHAGAEHRPYRSDFVYRSGKENADQQLASYRKELEPYQQQERAAFERYRDFQRKPINVPGYNRDVAWQEVLDLREQIRKVAKTFPDLEIAFAASEGDPDDVHVQKQGEPKSRGHLVRRGFLQILGGQTLGQEVHQSGRLQLANWIADPNNPLTARVIANRIWHHHFGRGLVTSTSDFGVRGVLPSHPKLLDYLASYLVDNGWSIKQLHRLIVGSQTYRLSSAEGSFNNGIANAAIDPENICLWRGNRRRLDAEQLRDSVLVFSNQLDRSPGQSHPFPHRLTYYFRQHEPFVGDFASNRRTIYLFRQRIRKNRYLDMFDGPDGNLHVGARRPTTTSLQSLYLMNSEFIDEQSQRIAERLLASASTRGARVGWAYHHIFGRDPESEEIRATSAQIDSIARQVQGDADEKVRVAWSSMIRAALCSNEFLFVE